MGGLTEDVDMDLLATDLKTVYGPLLGMSLSDVNYANIIPKINEVARKHRMTMPKEFVLITKQLFYFDRYAKLLAPTLNIFTDPPLIMSMINEIVKVRSDDTCMEQLETDSCEVLFPENPDGSLRAELPDDCRDLIGDVGYIW